MSFPYTGGSWGDSGKQYPPPPCFFIIFSFLSSAASSYYNALTRIVVRSESEGQEVSVPKGGTSTATANSGNEFRQHIASRQRHGTTAQWFRTDEAWEFDLSRGSVFGRSERWGDWLTKWGRKNSRNPASLQFYLQNITSTRYTWAPSSIQLTFIRRD
jgi:hypothetical protein